MKRSDALKLIEELFNLELGLYPKHNPAEIFAENLLCHMEETIGMLPPTAKLKHLDKVDNSWEDE